MATEVLPKLDPGSVTQLYLHKVGEGLDFSSELHVAHYPDGDVANEPQYYGIVKPINDDLLRIMYDRLDLPIKDRKVVEQLLGSFRWVRYIHTSTKHTRGGQIFTDYPAMATGYWTISYW